MSWTLKTKLDALVAAEKDVIKKGILTTLQLEINRINV